MSSQLLQIFAKAPVVGQVKTRLAVDVGSEKACAIYKQLLTNTLNNAVSKHWPTEIWCSPDVQHPYLQSLGKQHHTQLKTQSSGDLGERMLLALQAGLTRAEKVVLIGSDCPVISVDYIQAAFDALDTSDVVFGPVEDGGYVLVACKHAGEQMFTNVEWSCAETLKQNITAIKKVGLKQDQLSTLWDIDTVNDWQRWVQ
ncbi:MAG: hypothetical protein COB22_08415 [Cycloclasticus sp.]|nr:MAG: hypothetical protein COB22_08415 [Cycloclasticus sp.]